MKNIRFYTSSRKHAKLDPLRSKKYKNHFPFNICFMDRFVELMYENDEKVTAKKLGAEDYQKRGDYI